jgi:hypothetical protein
LFAVDLGKYSIIGSAQFQTVINEITNRIWKRQCNAAHPANVSTTMTYCHPSECHEFAVDLIDATFKADAEIRLRLFCRGVGRSVNGAHSSLCVTVRLITHTRFRRNRDKVEILSAKLIRERLPNRCLFDRIVRRYDH